MSDAEHLVQTLRSQGRLCAASGSPMYAELLDRVATDVQASGVFATILSGHIDTPAQHAIPLRLLGGLHRLVLDDRIQTLRRWYPSAGGNWHAETAWPDIVDAAASQANVLRAALDQPPQTNEVGRSAALLGGLLHISRQFGLPVRLFEIGCSAGLNLRADQYSYGFAGGRWGPADSPVAIENAWLGELPPAATVQIIERHGYDTAPIDITTADGELTLLSYVWPDQTARLDRLRGALDVARDVPAHVHRRTAHDAVRGLTLAEGTVTVLWHSITWQYLSASEQTAVRGGIEALAAHARAHRPFAHLTLEPTIEARDTGTKFLVRVCSWPGSEDRVLAECQPHGPPVRWQ
ncbi:DUF2332 domain-containing protein [Mycobacterium sp.]|uniref:DUF2332 domain-containing protein n=1 Tax=Mycobacterium sp. TaxID=1785 RepID=UPI003BA9ACDC